MFCLSRTFQESRNLRFDKVNQQCSCIYLLLEEAKSCEQCILARGLEDLPQIGDPEVCFLSVAAAPGNLSKTLGVIQQTSLNASLQGIQMLAKT